MPSLDALARVEIRSRAEWRAWLRANHAQPASIWLVYYKKHAPDRHVPYDAIVEEALCFGWIDGLSRALDDDRAMMLLAPRKPGSTWSRLNKTRVERLLAAGQIEPPGLAAIERARADGSWSSLDDAEAGIVPDDLRAALDRRPAAARRFAAFSPSVRRNLLAWVGSARRPETRARRIAELVRCAARGLRANLPSERRAAGPEPARARAVPAPSKPRAPRRRR